MRSVLPPLYLARALCLMAAPALLSGCAALQEAMHTSSPTPARPGDTAPATSTAPRGGDAPAGPAAAASPSTAQPAFEQVVKGAERQDGPLPIWRRQDKVWIELSPHWLNRPLFLSPRLLTGIGESGIFGGMLQSRWAQVGRPQWVEFRKVQQQVQLVAINASFTALRGTPQARAVASAFSPSLLGSVPAASAPHSGSGAILVDANALLLTDMLGMAQSLQRAYRQSYAFDNRNSSIARIASQDQAMVFEVVQHFGTSGISAGGATGAPPSSIPMSVPDPRSLFVTVQYTLTPLPDQAMTPRPADPRVGYFATTVADFTDDLSRTPRMRHINRWRLDKKMPDAAESEPVQPIVYTLDESIPLAYRDTIREGILAWNKAFEAIGLRNAIQVRMPGEPVSPQAPASRASIRWMTNSQPAFGAIGPTHVDPRSGEILHAHIALESLSSRAMRTARSQFLLSPSRPLADGTINAWPHEPAEGMAEHTAHDGQAPCQHSLFAAEQLDLALDVLSAGGTVDPDSPEVRQFVLAYIKDTTMHEVGHTLGLRHNFRASRWRTAQELSDPVLGREHGNSASVMDYAPINLPLPGQQGGAPFQTTLGPYDHWAIEYGYRPLPPDAAQATALLRDIARRSEDPAYRDALAYGTDEDNMQGLDPEALAFDLGRDPVVFARHRLTIVRDLLQRQATRALQPDDDPSLLRRTVGYALRDMARTSQILLRQIGGIVTRRDGPSSARDTLDPLPADQQRAALQVLMHDILSPHAFDIPPALQRRLSPDYLDRQDAGDQGLGGSSNDLSWAAQQLALQRPVLAALMSEDLAERLLDNMDKVQGKEAHPLTPMALQRSLRETLWQDTPLPADQARARRNLQREHVNRLAAAVVRKASDRADVRAMLRDEARQLQRQLQSSAPRPAHADTAEAIHRQDCLDTLNTALAASVIRTTP
ncbi:MAG: zinc-dependent metalloprotease [Aquabacterium sp.]